MFGLVAIEKDAFAGATVEKFTTSTPLIGGFFNPCIDSNLTFDAGSTVDVRVKILTLPDGDVHSSVKVDINATASDDDGNQYIFMHHQNGNSTASVDGNHSFVGVHARAISIANAEDSWFSDIVFNELPDGRIVVDFDNIDCR